MPRRLRHAAGGYVHHILNRGVGRATLFNKGGHYFAFRKVTIEAQDWLDVRLLAYCLMPNHWHLVLGPEHDGDLSEYMCWLTVRHIQRWHAHHHMQGIGPLYQGRFKAFPIAGDGHLLRVLGYVNAIPCAPEQQLGAGLPTLASPGFTRRTYRETFGLVDLGGRSGNGGGSTVTFRRARYAEPWQKETAARLGLESSL